MGISERKGQQRAPVHVVRGQPHKAEWKPQTCKGDDKAEEWWKPKTSKGKAFAAFLFIVLLTAYTSVVRRSLVFAVSANDDAEEDNTLVGGSDAGIGVSATPVCKGLQSANRRREGTKWWGCDRAIVSPSMPVAVPRNT